MHLEAPQSARVATPGQYQQGPVGAEPDTDSGARMGQPEEETGGQWAAGQV
jgi:hypothetical protein